MPTHKQTAWEFWTGAGWEYLVVKQKRASTNSLARLVKVLPKISTWCRSR